MNTVLNTALKQMECLKEYEYPALKWSKVYPYNSIDDAKVDFSTINSEDMYAYYAGDDFHILFSDDDYQYHVTVHNKFIN